MKWSGQRCCRRYLKDCLAINAAWFIEKMYRNELPMKAMIVFAEYDLGCDLELKNYVC